MKFVAPDWQGRHHRDVTAALIKAGWQVCGAGDWALTLRSPQGDHAARVCPFDPAYEVFVRLCQALPHNRFVPRVDSHIDLDGGGQLTIMEFLTPADDSQITQVTTAWHDADGEGDLAEVRGVATQLDTAARGDVAWWDGIDLNGGNIMVAAGGQVKIVDIFCLDGQSLYEALLHRPEQLRQRIPAEKRRHMADIGHIARSSTAAEVAALRHAADLAGCD